MTSRSSDLWLWFLLPSTTPDARFLQAFLSLSLSDYYPRHDLDTIMENPTEMELVNASLPSSRSSTPSLTNCERRQLVNQDLKKFSIMLSNVSHTIECIAPITSDDDPTWLPCTPDRPTSMKDSNKP
ncbi:hypothetical protein TNCV_3172881 [Trichonephila clavipes]|nr:hypothetical protein TNCV_3172881 [Trichonephila clavipes]